LSDATGTYIELATAAIEMDLEISTNATELLDSDSEGREADP
jgi:hypothetical protein